MAVIIATCRAVGWLAKRYMGQPQVVGEMIAGVILGAVAVRPAGPGHPGGAVPAEAKSILFVGAQMGVGLYMFMVGLGFRRDLFKTNARSAAAVSPAGMAAPFLVAIAIAPWLISQALFGEGIAAWQAMLFMGAAIAITAFPMLARIIHERGLSGTRLGSLSLAAGAIDDAGAWCVLAIVLASFGDGAGVAVKAIAGGAAFAAFMLILGPRLLAPLGRKVEREGKLTLETLGIVLILFMLSAWAMDAGASMRCSAASS